MGSDKNIKVDLESEESWKYAKRYASLLNPIPSQLILAIKGFWTMHRSDPKGEGAGSTTSAIAALRLIDKSDSLKMPLYFAASHLRPERFEQKEDDTSKALLNILGPGLFAALLAITYYFRRLGKLSQAPAWETLSKDILLNMELGFALGKAIPEVGEADGLLIGGIRYFGLGPLMLKDNDSYQRYRNLKKHLLDPIYEHGKWRCDYAQVASHLLLQVGIDTDLIHARRALMGDSTDLPDDKPELKTWSATAHWIKSLKLGSEDPEKLGSFTVTDSSFKNLLDTRHQLIEQGSTFEWIRRGYSDKSESKESKKP